MICNSFAFNQSEPALTPNEYLNVTSPLIVTADSTLCATYKVFICLQDEHALL